MYSLSVACLFRNEENSIVEWIEHYLFHGAEHIYLIDDSSTDTSCELVKLYIERGVLTLFQAKWNRYLGRQRDMYNHFLMPILHETQWLLIVDMDEYMWSPTHVNMNHILKDCLHIGQIQVKHSLFGSNGHIAQPKTIVQSFIRRANEIQFPGNLKYFMNTNFKFSSINVHHATFVDKNDELKHFLILNEKYFRLNHYCCQSREFWDTVKCSRGDSDECRKRTPGDFESADRNDVEDTSLLEQNMPLYTLATSVDTVDRKE
jgi:hypothetical protein